MIKILVPKRRVLFEKFYPTFNNIEYLVENTLIDCEIYKSRNGSTYYHVRQGVVYSEIAFFNTYEGYPDAVSILLKLGIVHYDLRYLQYETFELYLKKVFMNLFNIINLYDIKIFITDPSSYNFVKKDCNL